MKKYVSSFAPAFGSVWAWVLVTNSTTAQIVPDATLPVNSIVTPQGNTFQIEGGTTAGTNLFHSFTEFSVPTGNSAFFNNSIDIQTIFSRVTGSSISNIDGSIRANGTANLFLINPNGIIFGPNARLNIGGSFLASTARSINFADGTQFSANPTQSQAPSLLTISVPVGLQLETNPGKIVDRAAATDSNGLLLGLQVSNSNSIALVGGDIAIEGGGLNAPGGRIELGGLAAAGTVGLSVDGKTLRLNFPPGSNLANLTLADDARVSTRSTGGGEIIVNTNNFTATNGGRLVGGTEGAGKAGDIIINANNIELSGIGKSENGSGFYNLVLADASGNGGNIFVNTGSLSLIDGATINGDTDGLGNGANIFVIASGNVSLTGNNTAIFSDVNSTAIAQGGSISIQAQSVSLYDGARLSASIFGQGNAGSILLQAKEAISLSNSNIFSNIVSGGEGSGGSINIAAGSLSLLDGAQLQTDLNRAFENLPAARGNAGNITIDVRDTVTIKGANKDGYSSAIFSNVETGSVGNGGNIEIRAGAIFISDDARLSASIFGQGKAGSILLQAKEAITLSNSNIFSSVESGGEGNGGSINIAAGSLSLLDGAQLQTDLNRALENLPGGRGNAGNINIDVRDTVTISGENKNGINSGIVSSVGSGAIGNGGNIDIRTGAFSMSDRTQLTASTLGQGNAGNISVRADDAVSLQNSSILSGVEAGAVGDGGNINIQAGSVSLTDGGQIVATVYGETSELPAGRGNAGNITIVARDAVTLSGTNSNDVLQPTALSSRVESGATGNGGNINIQASSFSLLDNASVSGQHFGVRGNASSISIQTRDSVLLDKSVIISTLSHEETVGRGGNISIETNSLLMTNQAILLANTFGQGDAGNISVVATGNVSLTGKNTGISSAVGSEAVGNGGKIDIQTGSFSMTDGASLSGTTSGQGNAGSIFVQAKDSVSIANSQISTNVAETAVGNGGDISILAGSVSLTDGASLLAITSGKGNGGNVFVQATDLVSLVTDSSISSSIFNGKLGNGGNIDIRTGALSLNDESFLSASNFGGQGNAGNIFVQATSSVSVTNSSNIATFIGKEAVGNGGDINITVGSLLLTNNSLLLATSLGKGDSGNVLVQAKDSVSLANNSYINTAVDKAAVGDGGNINITADSFLATNSSGTFASTSGQGKAGDITIATNNTISFDGGSVAFSTEETGAVGQGGTVRLIGKSLFLSNKSGVSVTSNGSEGAGNVELDAGVVRLDNSSIEATTAAGNEGSITVRSNSLILRQGSNITTNATGGESGGNINFLTRSLQLREESLVATNASGDRVQGGNINIEADAIAALENSDISANSVNDKGGAVTINASAIFGAQPRTGEELQILLQTKDPALLNPKLLATSDITATGANSALSGTVVINTPEVDPSSGLIELPTNLGDATGLIASTCRRGEDRNQFLVTGRGGLPPNPNEAINDEATWFDLRATAGETSSPTPPLSHSSPPQNPHPRLVEASGWIVDRDGKVVLTPRAIAVTPQSPALPAYTCLSN